MENTERSQKSKDVLLTMVGLLGLKAEVSEKSSGKNIILSVSTDEPGRLIGRNGSSLDSVGLLMNRILKKDDLEFPKVIIDVDGYDKKSKRDRDRKKGRRKDNSRSMNKTVILNENPVDNKPEAVTASAPTAPEAAAATAPVDGEINYFVDNDSETLAPVTTVALNKGPSHEGRGTRNRNNNNNRNRNSNNNRNKNNNQRQDRTAVMEKSNHSEGENLKPNPRTVESKAPENTAPVSKAPQTTAPVSKAPQTTAPVSKAPQTTAPASKAPENKSANRLQMQCRNTLKEVKRWGADSLMPPMSEAECSKAIDYLKNEKGVNAAIDSSKSNGDKKRVRVSINS
jgi:hypothetical protein